MLKSSPSKPVFLFFSCIFAASAAAPIGKVYRHDPETGRVEVAITSQEAAASRLWIDAEKSRISCLYLASFHTKYVCNVAPGAASLVGKPVFNRQLINQEKIETTDSVQQNFQLFETEEFELKYPKDWQYEKKKTRHMFKVNGGNPNIIVLATKDDTNNMEICDFLKQVSGNLEKNYTDQKRTLQSRTLSPDVAKAAAADEACYDVYDTTVKNIKLYQSVVAYRLKSLGLIYVVVESVAEKDREKFGSLLHAISRTFKVKNTSP